MDGPDESDLKQVGPMTLKMKYPPAWEGAKSYVMINRGRERERERFLSLFFIGFYPVYSKWNVSFFHDLPDMASSPISIFPFLLLLLLQLSLENSTLLSPHSMTTLFFHFPISPFTQNPKKKIKVNIFQILTQPQIHCQANNLGILNLEKRVQIAALLTPPIIYLILYPYLNVLILYFHT